MKDQRVKIITIRVIGDKGLASQEELNELCAPYVDCSVEHGGFAFINCVDRCIGSKQQLSNLHMPALSCEV